MFFCLYNVLLYGFNVFLCVLFCCLDYLEGVLPVFAVQRTFVSLLPYSKSFWALFSLVA